MKEDKKVVKKINPIDILFDEDNYENIVLYNEKNEPVEFEQIALIPHNDNFFAILQPVQKFEGINEDEAFAFEIIKDEEHGDSLQLVEDDALIDTIFDEYKKMYNAKNWFNTN